VATRNKTAIAPTVGRETLDGTPDRALALLRGIGTSAAIRGTLEAAGYSERDHREGWTLLHAASGFHAEAVVTQEDTSVRDAIREIDSWDESGFRIVRATLTRRYPDQAASVLRGLSASTGAAAVVGVATLLDRLDELEGSKDKTDRAALALLGERGIDAAKRKHLRGLVTRAHAAPKAPVVDASAVTEALEEHVHALAALRAWYEEWSEIARATVTRRDYLIRLGLAKRKSNKAQPAPNAPA